MCVYTTCCISQMQRHGIYARKIRNLSLMKSIGSLSRHDVQFFNALKSPYIFVLHSLNWLLHIKHIRFINKNLNLITEKLWLGLIFGGPSPMLLMPIYIFFLFVLGLFLIMNTHQNGYPHAFRQSIHCHFL